MEETARPDDARRVAGALLEWYRRHRRDLPWRRIRDPYAVWVSEIMLQQTRVAVVIPYYERFLQRFPGVRELSAAGEADLLEAWSGLGYYRRVRQMQQAAHEIVDGHGGRFPSALEDLLRLPGIGRYTAAAIASIAFEQPHAAVDGNVLRVLARVWDEARDTSKSAIRAELLQRAQQWIEAAPEGSYGDFNQALMELGATVCAPRSPRCLLCPLRPDCRARRRGVQQQRPVSYRKQRVEQRELAVALVERRGRLLLRRRGHTEAVMPGFWELPQAEGTRLAEDCFAALGIRRGARIGEFRHGITFRSYRGFVYECSLEGARPGDCRWVPRARLESLPLTTITRKSLRAATSAASVC